jgi:hypothetical protein
LPVDFQPSADDGGICAEPAAPQLLANDGHADVGREVLVLADSTAQDGARPEHVERTGGHERRPKSLWHSVRCREGDAALVVAMHMVEGRLLRSKATELECLELTCGGLDRHQSVRAIERQWAQQDAVHEGGGQDHQSRSATDGQEPDSGRQWCFHQRPPPTAHIPPHCIEHKSLQAQPGSVNQMMCRPDRSRSALM